jgi:hypothetical protein
LTRFGRKFIEPTVATWLPASARPAAGEAGDPRGDQPGVPHAHRCRPGVVRHADQLELRPGDALDALDRADGHPFQDEHRPLLDVQLDVAVHGRRSDRRGAAVADAREVLADRAAVDALDAQCGLQRQIALEHEAPHHAGREARALLVGEEGDGERILGADAGILQRLDDLEPGEHAVVAVVQAAGAMSCASRSSPVAPAASPRGFRRRCRCRRR